MSDQNRLDYNEVFCEAVSVLIDKRLEKTKFDQTIEAKVVDKSKATLGTYTVAAGDMVFTAYSSNNEYDINDTVMVIIPQGNYDLQKIILGKKFNEVNSASFYTNNSIQSSMIDATGNILFNNSLLSIELIANNPLEEYNGDCSWNIGEEFKRLYYPLEDGQKEYVNVLWNNYSQETSTIIKEQLKTQLENYFVFDSEEEVYKTIIENNGVPSKDPCYNLGYSVLLSDIKFPQTHSFYQHYDYLGLKADFQTFLEKYHINYGNYGIMLELVYADNNKGDFSDFINLDSDNFLSNNVYDFKTPFIYEKVFDISDFKNYPIREIRVYGYQRNNFKNKDNNKSLVYSDFSNIKPNIIIDNIYLCLGYSLDSFQQDIMELISDNKKSDTNKIVYLQWIHKNNNNISFIAEDNIPYDYNIQWKYYKNNTWSEIDNFQLLSLSEIEPANNNYYITDNNNEIFLDWNNNNEYYFELNDKIYFLDSTQEPSSGIFSFYTRTSEQKNCSIFSKPKLFCKINGTSYPQIKVCITKRDRVIKETSVISFSDLGVEV